MVKLIRLTTENDNNFNVDMDSDLKLGPNASVALQNLTFETQFQTLVVSGDDREVKFNFDVDEYELTGTHTNSLKLEAYDSANYPDFFDDLAGTLNETCSIGSSTKLGVPGDTAQMNNYMQFNVSGVTEKKAIQMRLAPMLHPLLKTRAFDYQYEAADEDSGYERSAEMFTSHPAAYSDSDPSDPTTSPGIILRAINQTGPDPLDPLDYGLISREAGGSTDIDRYFHAADGVEWSKGSAVWWCRVHLLVDSGQGKDASGFGIGLSKTKHVGGAVLPDASRDYEIRVFKPGVNVEYIDPSTAHTLTDGHVANVKVDATDVGRNDIMMLRKDRNVIRGLYITEAGGGYLDLPAGGNWLRAPSVETERFDQLDLGDIATYRRTQPADPTYAQWWQAVDATNWNIYNTKPVFGATPSSTGVAVLATGVITVAATTFTPTTIPDTVPLGTITELFSHTIPQAEKNLPLYPYGYVQAGVTLALMGQPSITLDPFAIEKVKASGYKDIIQPKNGDIYGYDGTVAGGQLEDGYERSTGDIILQLPSLDQKYYGADGGVPNQLVHVTIAKDILRWMGFAGTKYVGDGNHTFTPPFNTKQFLSTFGFEIIPEDVFSIKNSDNYVVVLDSNPLVSFDASTTQGLLTNDPLASKIGRRANILATLPINDNDGFVESEVNELVYIDLDNQMPQNISNLRLRVLDKALFPVKTTGTSVMTLLFKDN